MPGNKHIPGSPKQNRQYVHIRESELKAGRPPEVARRIAAATVNQQKAHKGLAKNPTGRVKGK